MKTNKTKTPAVGEVPTASDTAACPPWHNERLGAWFGLIPNEQGGLRLRKVSGKPMLGPIDDEAENILIPRVVDLSAQNQALRAFVGELAEGLENCRSELKYLEDACDSAYARPSDTIVADTAALIAKAKEAGL